MLTVLTCEEGRIRRSYTIVQALRGHEYVEPLRHDESTEKENDSNMSDHEDEDMHRHQG